MTIAITPGEPAGIGPDVVLAWLANQQHAQPNAAQPQIVIIADPNLLAQRAKQLGLNVDLPIYSSANTSRAYSIKPVSLTKECQAGVLRKDNASYVLATLEQAIKGCHTGQFDAMVTGPVHKGIINEAGFAFSGHTEMLAQLTHAPLPLMMLATSDLRVLLATTHLPLRAVPDAITRQLIVDITRIAAHDLRRYFAIENPHILVCGLNPHAGEDGHLGHEDLEQIVPAITQLNNEGINASGPWPADTAFAEHHLATADAVLAMYHDQGLPVLKHKGFGRAANITLGLPIIRTSVDHGTALALAGTGQAHYGSLNTAIEQATIMLKAKTAI